MNKIYNLFYGFIEFVLLKTFLFIKIIKFYIYIYMQNIFTWYLKVSCRRTDNLQPGTTIIKNLQYNGILNMTSFM